jgi:antitoxin component HigA of HigAB toxin-antitoxin module
MSRLIAPRRVATQRRLPTTFDNLNALLPLRPIEDRDDLKHARKMVDALAVLARRTVDQEDYLETLSTLIEKYEQERNADQWKASNPIDVLRFLMEGHEMSASDLGRLLGHRELGAAILRGERQLSKAHIIKLAKHFGVGPGLFLVAPKA